MSRATRIALIAAVAVVSIILAVVFAGRFGSDPKLSPSPLIGQPVPDVELDLVESDETLTLRELEGEILVVNFWAPWCVPCRAEHAELAALAEGYADFGVTVIGAAYQSQEPDVIRFLDDLGRGYPVGMDVQSRAAIEFGVRGVPETYFVDRAGIVVGKVSGPVDRELAGATLDQIILGGQATGG